MTDGQRPDRDLDPTDLGITAGAGGSPARWRPGAQRRGPPPHLGGERGPVRDVVLLNAAAAIAAATPDPDGALTSRLAAGLARATEAIDSGAAADRPRRLGRRDAADCVTRRAT